MILGPHSTAAARFAFYNTYARELEGFYVPWTATQVARPALVQLNRALAEELGLDAEAFDSEEGTQIFAGNVIPEGAVPLAQVYAGHQFGGFSPQLGDGRALLLGEVLDRRGRRRDIQLKGAGPTPFSRGGDGRAALGPVLREYLLGEVMNTDNMAISGESIDYGPCAFMEQYDPATVFSSIDTQGRYTYANQPRIAQWNLARLAETLLPLLDPDRHRALTRATEVVQAFPAHYARHWLQGMRAKLGLLMEDTADLHLATGFLTALEGQHVDYTLAFRYLADAAVGEDARLRALFADASAYDRWSGLWRARLAREAVAPWMRAQAMRRGEPPLFSRKHTGGEGLCAARGSAPFTPFAPPP